MAEHVETMTPTSTQRLLAELRARGAARMRGAAGALGTGCSTSRSNHGAIRPGGLESYTQDLYEAFRDSEEFEPICLRERASRSPHATAAPRLVAVRDGRRGPEPVPLLHGQVRRRPVEIRRTVRQVAAEKQVLTTVLPRFPARPEPDVVHFQHTTFLGYDMIRGSRNTLPDVPDSVHPPRVRPDLPPRRADGAHEERGALPGGVAAPLPRVLPRRSAPQTFYMRKRFIQSHMSLVDCFIAPSEYVKRPLRRLGAPAATGSWSSRRASRRSATRA